MPIEYFVRDSDNQIKLTLTEDAVAISGAWTGLDIFVDGTLVITRTTNGNGITLDTGTGLLTITPGDLTTLEKTAFGLFAAGEYHEVQLVVTSSINDDGAVFGGAGAEPLYFFISDKPA